MKKVFLEPGEEFHCPSCNMKTVFDVKRTIYFSDTIASLTGMARLNTYTSGGGTRIDEAKSMCAACGTSVYEELVRKIHYSLPDELFEI